MTQRSGSTPLRRRPESDSRSRRLASQSASLRLQQEPPALVTPPKPNRLQLGFHPRAATPCVQASKSMPRAPARTGPFVEPSRNRHGRAARQNTSTTDRTRDGTRSVSPLRVDDSIQQGRRITTPQCGATSWCPTTATKAGAPQPAVAPRRNHAPASGGAPTIASRQGARPEPQHPTRGRGADLSTIAATGLSPSARREESCNTAPPSSRGRAPSSDRIP